MSDDDRQDLEFEDDKGAGRARWIALGLTVIAIGWMLSGYVLPAGEEGEASASEPADIQPPSVATRIAQAEEITLFFSAEGQAQPDRETGVRVETSGEVAEVLVRVGDQVAAGQVLARLTTKRLQADLARAEEEFDRAAREFENAQELLDRGVATVDRVVSARAALAAARAGRTSAEEALDAARVEAPFDGRIERFDLDAGEFVSAGSEAGRIVDNQPLTVTLQVPQRSHDRLQGAGEAQVTFITGQTRRGRITFLGSAARADTRTFRAELVVDNEGGTIPSGLSAQIRVPTGQARAHFIAPSAVSLNTEGEIGAKTVEDGRVVFHAIEIVRAEVDGLWVTGLPERAALITIGQGYVQDGEEVRATPEEASDDTADQP